MSVSGPNNSPSINPSGSLEAPPSKPSDTNYKNVNNIGITSLIPGGTLKEAEIISANKSAIGPPGDNIKNTFKGIQNLAKSLAGDQPPLPENQITAGKTLLIALKVLSNKTNQSMLVINNIDVNKLHDRKIGATDLSHTIQNAIDSTSEENLKTTLNNIAQDLKDSTNLTEKEAIQRLIDFAKGKGNDLFPA